MIKAVYFTRNQLDNLHRLSIRDYVRNHPEKVREFETLEELEANQPKWFGGGEYRDVSWAIPKPVPESIKHNVDAIYALYNALSDKIPDFPSNPLWSKNSKDWTDEDWEYLLSFSADREKAIEFLVKKYGE